MQVELLKDCLITRVLNDTVAGQTDIQGTQLDMSGFDAVMFIAVLGTFTDAGVATLTAQEVATNVNSGGTLVPGSTAAKTGATSGNGLLVTDVIRPSKRYVYPDLNRQTQNIEIQAIIAIQYRARTLPVTQSTSVLASALSTPEV